MMDVSKGEEIYRLQYVHAGLCSLLLRISLVSDEVDDIDFGEVSPPAFEGMDIS